MPRKPNTTKDHYHDPFPCALRELVDARNMTQEQLTEVLGVKSRQSVTGYLDGSTAPTAEKIAAVARFFGVSSDWLLGLSAEKSPDADLRATCLYTGLNGDVVELIKLSPSIRSVLNTLGKTQGENAKPIIDTPLFQFATSFLKIEKAAVSAAATVLSDDPEVKYNQAEYKKEQLELALFRFTKVCQNIPQMVYLSEMLMDEVNDLSKEYDDKRIMAYIESQREAEAQSGEHQDN